MWGKTKQIAKANLNNDWKKLVELKRRKWKYGEAKTKLKKKKGEVGIESDIYRKKSLAKKKKRNQNLTKPRQGKLKWKGLT